MSTHADPTMRFSNRVDDYIRYRPGYPLAILSILEAEIGLTSAAVVADVGSGTGISSELFLANGNTVYAVEPNDAMRMAAERLHGDRTRFNSIAGQAEATTLPDQSIDLVVAGQAFHWFDQAQAKLEFERILKPGGWAVLMWNSRRTDTTPFVQAYESLLHEFALDYHEVNHKNIDETVLRKFYEGAFGKRSIYNEQRLDYGSLEGRLLSSSYAPAAGHPQCEPMLARLREIFESHQIEGEVVLEYDTEIYWGRTSNRLDRAT